MADDQQQQQQQDEELYEGDELGEGYEEEIPVDGGAVETSAEAELEAMKKKLKEMEDEAARLRALQAGATGGEAAAGTSTADVAAKEEIDARSVYVGGVDYSCTPEELQQLFQSCGTVNRVTILTDKFGSPKGFAYVEFLEVDAVSNAMLLDNTELRGRNIKVVQKRTNVPGLKVGRGRGRGRGGYAPPAYGGRGGYAPYGAPYGGRGRGGYGGFAPRGRGRGRGFYSPY
mmetsp:Transcript_18865/g.32245  ORF Transcript_18865/g.32245 Transcript_18865/m.32245 type:complete len:230 (-) Transcript_18865:594-1283(-)